MKTPLLALAFAFGIVAPACRKHPEPTPPAASSTAPAAPSLPVTLPQVTQALQTYMQVNSDFPKDLNVLVNMKLLPNLPPPPPGKRYVIDRKDVRVSLADE